MKLNEHSKNKLRKEIEEAVKRVPEGQRIHLDNELIDDLIFLKIDNKDEVTVKFPIWTGEFLRKIDLSEISFENVHWLPVIFDASCNFDIKKLSKFGQYEKEKEDDIFIVPIIGRDDILNMPWTNVTNLSNLINFSYTNINPNLSNQPDMCSVNLEGVYLHYSDFKFDSLYNCNLKDTKSSIVDSLMFTYLYDMRGTNFSNCNLRSVQLDFDKLLVDIDKSNLDIFPIFTNTGVNIKFNNNKNDSNIKELVLAIIASGKIDGCYLNGNLIDSNKVNKNKIDKQSILDEYKTMEAEIFKSTLGSIEEQIKGLKGK